MLSSTEYEIYLVQKCKNVSSLSCWHFDIDEQAFKFSNSSMKFPMIPIISSPEPKAHR